MTKKEFNELLEKYGPEELVENYVFPVKLSKKQKEKADIALREALAVSRQNMTSNEILRGYLLQMHYQIKDYLKTTTFDKEKTFSHYLKRYIDIHKLTLEAFADEIKVPVSELQNFMDNNITPSHNILVRMEIHSQNIIPATDWLLLIEKEAVHSLANNKALRLTEQKFVSKHVAA
jgi:hypothetical protein